MTRTIRIRLFPFVVAAAVAIAARQSRALTTSGALAATAVGGAVLSGTGIRGAVAMAMFFVSSTLLGMLPRKQRGLQRRGNQRDAVQVLANGAVAAFLALVMTMRPDSDKRALLAGFGGALAAATADTWATEVGSRSSSLPRSIVTGMPVAVGTSGGVSPAGFLAAGAGAAAIGTLVSTGAKGFCGRSLGATVAVGGMCGALLDSVLGATVQEVRFCETCGVDTEFVWHACGSRTTIVRGLPRFDNDVVNLASTAAGAAAAMALHGLRRTYAARSTAEFDTQSGSGQGATLAPPAGRR